MNKLKTGQNSAVSFLKRFLDKQGSETIGDYYVVYSTNRNIEQWWSWYSSKKYKNKCLLHRRFVGKGLNVPLISIGKRNLEEFVNSSEFKRIELANKMK